MNWKTIDQFRISYALELHLQFFYYYGVLFWISSMFPFIFILISMFIIFYLYSYLLNLSFLLRSCNLSAHSIRLRFRLPTKTIFYILITSQLWKTYLVICCFQFRFVCGSSHVICVCVCLRLLLHAGDISLIQLHTAYTFLFSKNNNSNHQNSTY